MHLIPSFTFEGFPLGPVYVYTWGLTAAIGVLAAVWLASRKVVSFQTSDFRFRTSDARLQSNYTLRIMENQFWSLAIALVVSVFFGARLSYILETWNYYVADPLAALRLWEGGFSFFGGAVGGLLAGWLWSKKNKIDFLYLGWLFTPAWLFGLFFGRVGCFLIHDHLGKPTDLPWGIYLMGAYRHEPALYEAVWVLLVGMGLFFIDKKVLNLKSQSPMSNKILSSKSQLGSGHWGFIENWKWGFGYLPNTIFFPLSLLLYSVGRFFLDFLRADDPLYLSLTVAQWAGLIFVIWSVTLIIKWRRLPS